MRWRRVAILFVLLLLAAFLLVKESREPFLWLFVDDLLDPKPPPLVLPLSEGVAGRLYADTRPHIGKVARLQKGLVLTVDGKALIEEGFGFGLPIVEVAGQAYVSRMASVSRHGSTLVKRYQMDTLDTPSGFLRRKYEPVSSIGTVTVHFSPTDSGVDVTVDPSGLRIPWDRIYMMNEQGARLFTRYEEPGLVLEGDDLGKWQPTAARQGCLVANDGWIRFCVETENDSRRYFGRERYNQYYWVGIYVLSWAGIDLELEPPFSHFGYQVHVERAGGE
jgi:hypothetical protein